MDQISANLSNKTEIIAVVSGGFDPIHSGHIEYLNSAKQLGTSLIVGLNSDQWLINKKGKFFLPLVERMYIVENLKSVDMVLDFEDDSQGSAKNLIKKVRLLFPYNPILFCNGGDRTKTNIPEMDIQDNNLQFAFGVGGTDKRNSSSWILKRWETQLS